MARTVNVVADRSRENVVAALDSADSGAQAVSKGLQAARRRIDELEDLLQASEQARTEAERKVSTLEEKLRKVQATLA